MFIAVVAATPPVHAAPPADSARSGRSRPPPFNVHYFQYGVSLVGELVPATGSICPSGAGAPCILGTGTGLGIRGGYRARRPWYLGGAYEITRHDSSNLLRLGTLQQLRGEARRYFELGGRLVPYAVGSGGATLYGNEFGFETGGFLASLGAGVEFQLSRSTVVGAAGGYRPLLLRSWTDTAGELRADGPAGFGLAHLVFLEIILEVRQQLSRW